MDEICCRICLEPASRVDLIAPCACSGTRKWVHRSCLDIWRTTQEDRAFSKCTECLKPYKLIPRVEEDTKSKIKRQLLFCCYISRDISVVLALSQIVVLLFAVIVYASDQSEHNLPKLLHISHHFALFYYGVGLVLSLALVGLTGSCMACSGNSRSNPCDGCCTPGYHGYCYNPLYYGNSHGTSLYCYYCPECCCNSSSATSTTCCECSSCHCVNCLECGSGGCLGDGLCSGASGEAGLMILFVALVVFAVIGVFVCVFLGVNYIQKVIRTHMHVLGKKVLAKDFIVADLCEDTNIDISNRPMHLNSPYFSQGSSIEMMPVASAPPMPSAYSDSDRMMISENYSSRTFSSRLNSGLYQSLLSESQRQELLRLGLVDPEDEIPVTDSVHYDHPTSETRYHGIRSTFRDGREYEVV